MAGSGLDVAITVDSSDTTARRISDAVTSWNFAIPRGVLDITGTKNTAMTRQLLLADFSVNLNGPYDDTALAGSPTHSGPHLVFRDVGSSTVTRTTTIAIVNVGTETLETECVYTDYSVTRGQDGSLLWSAPGLLNENVVPTWVSS